MKNALKHATLIALVSLGMSATAAIADDDTRDMQELSKAFNLITVEQASEKALAAKPGVIKEAELDNRKFGKGWDYEFEIVDADGREWEVNIDAKTGAVRSVDRDWL